MLATCWQHVAPTRQCWLISPPFPFLPTSILANLAIPTHFNVKKCQHFHSYQKYCTTIIYPQMQIWHHAHHHMSQHCPKRSPLQPQISNIMSGDNESCPPLQSSPTTHTTMSSLPTPGQGGIGIGDKDDEDVAEMMPSLVPAILPALHT
jgi:hypothetical protein